MRTLRAYRVPFAPKRVELDFDHGVEHNAEEDDEHAHVIPQSEYPVDLGHGGGVTAVGFDGLYHYAVHTHELTAMKGSQ